MNKEIRMTSSMTASGSDAMIIEGKAIAFNERTCLYRDASGTEFYETILPEAVADSDFSDCCLKYNHMDSAPILARTRGGSLTVEKRNDGVYFRAELFNTQFSRDCFELVKADALKCSFAFTISEDGDSYDATKRLRTVRKIDKVWDLSIVNNPAYEGTYVASCRSYFEPKSETRRIEMQTAEVKEILKRNDITPLGIDWKNERISDLDVKDRLYYVADQIARGADPADLLTMATGAVAEISGAKEERNKAINDILAGDCKVIARMKEVDRMENRNENAEVRAFQKYISLGIAKMTEEERSALSTSGTGAVMPVDIYNKMITSEKYSDLLARATILNVEHAGTVKIPIMESTEATWKAENASVTPATGAITSLDLTGKELMRAIQYSASVEHMTAENFENWMADAVAREVNEALESAFVLGDGVDSPHPGLENLTLTGRTVTATDAITASDLAEAISKLPVKYAKNAILIMNAKTALTVVGLFKGTDEYAYNVADGASRFLGHEIDINEHVSDDKIFVVDPAELYVRFAQYPIVETDRSSGFLSAQVAMRCLAVVDFAWNTSAVASVSL